MSNKSNPPVATMGIDIGKNAFHVVGLDRRGMILLRQRWSRGQLEGRLANMPQCLIGMEPTRCGPVSNSSKFSGRGSAGISFRSQAVVRPVIAERAQQPHLRTVVPQPRPHPTCAYRLCHPNVVPMKTSEPSD